MDVLHVGDFGYPAPPMILRFGRGVMCAWLPNTNKVINLLQNKISHLAAAGQRPDPFHSAGKTHSKGFAVCHTR